MRKPISQQFFHLFSSKPFDFGGHCTSCHRQTNEMVSVDVTLRKGIPWALAEMAFHPLFLLSLKSVPIPYCKLCRLSLWMLRLCCFLTFIGLVALLVWIISDEKNKLRNSNVNEYLLVVGFLGIALIPYVYITLKELFMHVEVLHQDGVFCYRFRNAKIPELLERRGLCQRLPGKEGVWIVAPQLEQSSESGR